MEPSERERLRDILLKARNEGLFTPPSLRNTIIFPGELGGTNWGGVAADPTAGVIYVRSIDAPTMHIMSLRQPGPASEGGTPEQQGRALKIVNCDTCHGADRTGVTSPKELGTERFRNLLRRGRGQMPAFPHLTTQNVDALSAYLMNPSAGSHRRVGGHRHLHRPWGRSATTRPLER